MQWYLLSFYGLTVITVLFMDISLSYMLMLTAVPCSYSSPSPAAILSAAPGSASMSKRVLVRATLLLYMLTVPH